MNSVGRNGPNLGRSRVATLNHLHTRDSQLAVERTIAATSHTIALGAHLQSNASNRSLRIEFWIGVPHRRGERTGSDADSQAPQSIVSLDEGDGAVLALPHGVRHEGLKLAREVARVHDVEDELLRIG